METTRVSIGGSAKLYFSSLFRHWLWLAPPILLDPFDLWDRYIHPLAPEVLPTWEVPLMGAVVILVLMILVFSLLAFHEFRKSAQSEIDRLTPPPEHPRVTDAKAELLAMAQEGTRLASDPAMTMEAGQKWDLDASTLVANLTDLADSKAFRNFMYQARRQQEPIETARGCLLRGSSWLMRKADCLLYDELTPAFTHPAPKEAAQ